MKKLSVVFVTVVAASAFTTAGLAASSPAITQTSIAGAKVGLTASAYEKLFRSPYTTRRAGGDHEITLLTFPKSKVTVLFVRSSKAMGIITWNRAYTTDHGVGPCSTLTQLRKAYGAALVQDPFGQGPLGFDFQNLLFATLSGTPDAKVTAVAVYNSRAPHAQQDFGAHSYTGYAEANLVPACT